jgi:hypothetical protein
MEDPTLLASPARYPPWSLSNPDSPMKFLNRSLNGHLLSAYRHMAEKAFIALSDE